MESTASLQRQNAEAADAEVASFTSISHTGPDELAARRSAANDEVESAKAARRGAAGPTAAALSPAAVLLQGETSIRDEPAVPEEKNRGAMDRLKQKLYARLQRGAPYSRSHPVSSRGVKVELHGSTTGPTTSRKRGGDTDDTGGMCIGYNSHGVCPRLRRSVPCAWSHSCSSCGGDHPALRCDKPPMAKSPMAKKARQAAP